MPGSTIGKRLNFGYPGNVSRSADAIITNRPVKSTDLNNISFGDAAALNSDNTYSKMTATSATLGTALTSSSNYTSLTVSALPAAMLAGASVLLVSGANTQTTTLTADAASGATTLTVASFTANFAYPTSTSVIVYNGADQFAGVAVREVKQSTDYFSAQGEYSPGQPCDVLERGSSTVTCQLGTPTAGGAVYVRIALNGTYPNAVIGGFEAAADSTNTIQITNAKWKTGELDANNVAELTITQRLNP